MIGTDADVIVSYIGRKGWRTTRTAHGWRVERPDEGAALYLSFTPSWITLQAPLELAPESLSATQRNRVYRYLLNCNEAMFAAKFSRDPAGALTLGAELPLKGSIHRIDDALAAVARRQRLYCPPLADVDALALPPAEDRAGKELYFEEPPGIPAEAAAYFIRAVEPRGWGMRSKPKGVTWPLVYKGQRLFKAYLTITRAWAYFHVHVLAETPFSGARFSPETEQTFLEYLLSVNDAWYMAKLGLDEAGQVLAMLEMPTPDLDFDAFKTAANLLAAYLDLYAREIQIMAHLPSDLKLAERLASR